MTPRDEHAFVFFDAELALLSSPTAAGDSPARALAFHLLCSATSRISPRSMLSAMLSAPRRLQRAMYLARHLESGAPGAGPSSAGEMWATLAHDLRWAARSPRVRRHLTQLATAAHVTDPAAAVDEVRRALEHEILPVMHVRLYAASFAAQDQPAGAPSTRAIHARYLSMWSGPVPGPYAFASAYSVYLRHLARTADTPTSAMVDVVLALVSHCGRHSLEARALVTTLAQVVASTVRARQSATSRTRLSMLIGWLAALDAAGPPCAELLDLLVELHLRRGLEHQRSGDYSAGTRDVALACASDPGNTRARDALAGLVEAVQHRQQGMMPSVHSHEQIAVALERAARLAADFRDALSSGQEDGTALFQRRVHGHVCDVAWRLGLDATSAVHLGHIDTLLGILVVAESVSESGEEYADWVQQTALERDPRLVVLPWERLREALLLGPVASPFDLAGRLEPPTVNHGIPVRTVPLADPGAIAPPPPQWWQAWLFWGLSWRDLAWKLAAITGLILLGYGATSEISRLRERSAYAAVVEAVEHGDDAAALSQAAHILERQDPHGPLARHVRTLLEQALLRHTVQLVDQGQLDEAGAALGRYAALALETPDETTRATDGRATEEHLP